MQLQLAIIRYLQRLQSLQLHYRWLQRRNPEVQVGLFCSDRWVGRGIGTRYVQVRVPVRVRYRVPSTGPGPGPGTGTVPV